jgi:glycosyltransferase involved in cell wall biosynthesis
MKNVIYILHPGTANYPEIKAYREYFGNRYTVLDGTKQDYEKSGINGDCILWCIMGFYPKQYKAKFVIHDYRSLSIGKFCAAKDLVKKLLNSKPDLRIFQNSEMQRIMSFSDNIESLLLPMGIPDFIRHVEAHTNPSFHQRFCYIGEMSKERKFDLVLKSFIESGLDGKLLLVGTPDSEIFEEFKHSDKFMFTGKLPQHEALSAVKACRFSICYFPYHRPHRFQTPTKLLEYMALGMDIICNDAPSNISTLSLFNYKNAIITGRDIFQSRNEIEGYTPIENVNDTISDSLGWDSVIKCSGIDKYV